MTHAFRAFLASPGDVPQEREAFGRAVAEINDTICPLLDCQLEAVRWETHATPDAGRPQQVINEQIGTYDIFVGLMWRRFGTPSGVAGSGTEEEYRLAYKRWENDPEMPLMFYFCQAPFYPQNLDELDQMRKVLLFRKELEGKALAWTLADHTAFEPTIRKHLGKRLAKLVEARKGHRAPRARPNDATIEALRGIWPTLNPQTQRAFNIAYNENRLAGDPGIQTRDLFSALLRIQDAPLQDVVTAIPAAALPEPTEGPVSDQTYILNESPWLSGCIASSIRRLSTSVAPGQTIAPIDIFTDIAKHGTGQSVALLRKHNIGPDDIDAIVNAKHLSVVAT